MYYQNSDVAQGIGEALKIAAMDSTQGAQTQHAFTLAMISNTSNKNVDAAISALSECQEKHADPECKKTDAQKLEIENARRRQLARAEALVDRVISI